MIIRHSSFDVTVDNILERNSLTNLVDNMTVTVVDAIADVSAGPGTAIYRWSDLKNGWILVSKETTGSLSFETEELLIVDGKVNPKQIPTDFKIWDAAVLENNIVLVYPRIEDLVIDTNGISGLDSYNGKKLRFAYAYGTIASQITTAIEDYVDKSLLNNLKTVNGSEILGTGNIVVEGTLPELKTINNVNIVGAGNISVVTDAYTKSEVDVIISNLDSKNGTVADFETALI